MGRERPLNGGPLCDCDACRPRVRKRGRPSRAWLTVTLSRLSVSVQLGLRSDHQAAALQTRIPPTLTGAELTHDIEKTEDGHPFPPAVAGELRGGRRSSASALRPSPATVNATQDSMRSPRSLTSPLRLPAKAALRLQEARDVGSCLAIPSREGSRSRLRSRELPARDRHLVDLPLPRSRSPER